MRMREDETELDRILATARLDELELLDSPPKQSDMLSKELLAVGMSPTNNTDCTLGLAPCNGSETVHGS